MNADHVPSTRSLAALTEGRQFKAAIVLGSGLANVAHALVGAKKASYDDIAGLAATKVPGHPGTLHWGSVAEVPTLIFAGRTHLYEGSSVAEVVAPVTEAVRCGCETVVLTNAAGAINPALAIGEPCLISDHINLTGRNPIRDGSEGSSFLDLSDLYDLELRALARSIDPGLQEGVYAGVLGPSYETPAEIRMLATLGADLVGMSTVLEAIQARHLGARVLGISVVTNVAAGLTKEPLSHEEVARSGDRAAIRMEKLLRGVLAELRD